MDQLEHIINDCTLKQQFDSHVPLGVYILHVTSVNTLFDPVELSSFSFDLGGLFSLLLRSFLFHMLFSHSKIIVYISLFRFR